MGPTSLLWDGGDKNMPRTWLGAEHVPVVMCVPIAHCLSSPRQVPHYEFLELKLERQRAAYLRDKLHKVVAKELAS